MPMPENEDSDSDFVNEVQPTDLPPKSLILTGFAFFQKLHTKRLKRKYCLSFSEINKEVSKRWQKLNDA